MARPINVTRQTITIPNGTAITPEIDIGADSLFGIAATGTWAAAALTFQMSPDGINWYEIQGPTSVLTYNIAAGQFVAIDPSLWNGINAFKVRSGTVGTPVNQGAGCTLLIVSGQP